MVLFHTRVIVTKMIRKMPRVKVWNLQNTQMDSELTPGKAGEGQE